MAAASLCVATRDFDLQGVRVDRPQHSAPTSAQSHTSLEVGLVTSSKISIDLTI